MPKWASGSAQVLRVRLNGGGKVAADWPGLSASNLYEGRDLKPTLRMENIISEALAGHYARDPVTLRRTLFPDFA